MDCTHRHDSYMAMLQPCHQSGGKMTKITRFFRRKDEPNQPTVKPRKDVFDLLCREDWDAILSHDVEGEDIFNACVAAVKRGEIAGALKLLYRTSRSTHLPYTKSPLLNHAWQYLFAEVLRTQRDATTAMDMLVYAETDKRFDGEKALMNDLVYTLLTLEVPPSQTSPLQKVLQWCQREGLYSLGFNIALSAGDVEEAYAILTAVSSVSQEHVLMLQDIASQPQHVTHAESFVQLCFQRGRAEFAFALATKLHLWSVIEDKVEEEDTLPVPLLRSALTECVLGEKWDVVHKILSHLSEQDVREELLAIPKAFDVNTTINVLVECSFLPVALQLACSFGMPGKAAKITQDTGFVMDPALSVSTANACFDSHCSPEEFLVKGWDRDLLQHVLEAPRRKPFSHNQWRLVLSFLGASLPKEALLELIKRAIEEDAECLDQFIDQGVNDELMEALLTQDPEKYLSDNHLNCVAKLFYKEAGVDLKDAKNVLTDEAVFSVVNPKKGVVSAEEIKNSSGLDADQRNPDESSSSEQSPHDQRGKKSVLEGDVDWTTFVLRTEGIPVSPWWYVLKAAQTARKSPHMRPLAVRAAQEGHWNCLICLSIYGLRQHPLDLLLSLLHDHPERLVLSYLKQKELWAVNQDSHCCQEGWKVFRHRIDIWNLHSRDLLEERHKLILLGRALATDDWNTVVTFTSLDLPLPARRFIFRKVMARQEWMLAKEMFHQLPDKADPGIFQAALKKLDKTSEQLYGWMVESGLSNAYLAPEMFTRVLEYLDEKEASRRRAENLPEPHHSFWKRFFPKPKPKSPEDFQRPQPAVKEKNKDSITSTLGRVVQKAAVKGDWQLVMKTYEGGMGEEVKMAVVQEALRQGQWSVLTALTRRDAEVDLWYPQWADKVLKEAVNQAAWSCVEALVERRCRTEDAEWLFPYAVGLNKWSLMLRLVQHALPARLRKEALQTAIQKNEWTFVVDCTLHLAKTFPQDLQPDLKKAVLKSMTYMISALQPSSPPGATTFGLQLFSLVKVPDQGQGDIGGCGRQGDEEGRIQTGEEVVAAEEEGEEEKEWTTEDGTTPLQIAAGLGLWQVCQVLLHCGINPHPSPTPSHPEDVILLALRDNKPDVIHLLLDSDVKRDITPDVTDQVLQELLLTPTLALKADLSLLHKLLEIHSSTSTKEQQHVDVTQASAKEQHVDVTQASDVITDISCDVKMLEDQVRKVVDEAGASEFQPCVSRAVKSGQIVLPAFLSSRFPVTQRKCVLEVESCVPQKLGPSEKRSVFALSCGLEVGPRVKLRVDKEPRDTPMVRLLPPLVSTESSPPSAASPVAGAPATSTDVSPVL